MIAFSGVRSSWLMVARKRVLAASACSAALRASSSACSWTFRSVTSRMTATTSALRFGLPGAFERPAAHLDPDEVDLRRSTALHARHLPSHTKLDAARFAAARGVGQRGEIGRAIGDMNTIEQPMAEQSRDRRAQHRFGRRRNELHRTVAAMARDHVAHVPRQQAITFFFDGQQRHAGARQRLGRRRQGPRHRASPKQRRMPCTGAQRRADVRTAARRRNVRTRSARRRTTTPMRKRSRPRGGRPTTPPRAEPRPARSPQRIRCRRWSSPPPSRVRRAQSMTAHARLRSDRCATGTMTAG